MTATQNPTTIHHEPLGRPPWSGGRIAMVVLGALLAVFGAFAMFGGSLVLLADQGRDGDGYLTAGPGRLTTETYAISAESIRVHADGPDALYENALLGDFRLRLEPTAAGSDLFVGIGPADQVAAYLDRLAHDEFADLDVDPFRVSYVRHTGDRAGTAPGAQTFWAASDAGPGARTLTWPVTDGRWTVVIMNADGSAGIDADATVGGKLPVVRIAGIVSLVTGGIVVLVGLAMVVLTAVTRGPRRRPVTG
ncbi:MAG TPA: hypothetical protein VF657_18535 [Actinoplanes sp.]|jgi:hypothetical protein